MEPVFYKRNHGLEVKRILLKVTQLMRGTQNLNPSLSDLKCSSRQPYKELRWQQGAARSLGPATMFPPLGCIANSSVVFDYQNCVKNESSLGRTDSLWCSRVLQGDRKPQGWPADHCLVVMSRSIHHKPCGGNVETHMPKKHPDLGTHFKNQTSQSLFLSP